MSNAACNNKFVAAKATTALPDVSHEAQAKHQLTLNRVGMQSIQLPVCLVDPEGVKYRIPARIDAFVNLDDPRSKGIHMSRIYLRLRENLKDQPISLKLIQEILEQLRSSQEGLSTEAQVKIGFELPVERWALISDEVGFRHYPVSYEGTLTPKGVELILGFEILYSSTCPCSAALARHLVQQKFSEDFSSRQSLTPLEVESWLASEDSIVATPHAQRSRASFKVKVSNQGQAPDVLELIDHTEAALGTAVQSAVKRQDEQEFARLNGQNLMFCEDAARTLKVALNQDSRILDYVLKVEHIESLHPHEAVSTACKGVPGGWTIDRGEGL